MSSSDSFQIVVGVDGSDESLAALGWAVTEARLRHGQVRVVTGWQYPAVTAGMEGLIWDPASFEPAARSIQSTALQRVSAQDVPISRLVVQGPPAAVLLEASSDADLLVVGSRGHGGFRGLLLGSVSTQVVHHATRAVLVIRPRAEGKAANPTHQDGPG